jgi:aspartyl-tRNA(Asn)/glutamyl-tRNA(Gln) amidotransferase subunit A
VTIATREATSARERVEAALAAIERTQPLTNAFTVILSENALVEADALDRAASDPRGPLHGLPIVVKDVFDVAGLPTTGGCGAYLDRVARVDAAAVSALRAAGAIVVAKANQHELGAGATGLVSCHGPVAHPLDPARIVGGSSSGSAVAVASGAVPLALGTDTGGSIRMPASFCGITGLRPTPGRVDLTGALPMSPGYDTAGPMARDARGCAAAFSVLAGTPNAAAIGDPVGLRVGLPRRYFELVHPEVHDAVETAATILASLGAHVDWIDEPDIDEDFTGFRHVWADLAHHHRGLWDNDEVSDDVAALIETGRSLTGVDYACSRAHAEDMRRRMHRVLRNVDVLLTPATPYPAPRATDEEVTVTGGSLDVHSGGPSRLTIPVNEAGLPAVAFPVGASVDGLPLGAQLIGHPNHDEQLLDIVARYQDETGDTPTTKPVNRSTS